MGWPRGVTRYPSAVVEDTQRLWEDGKMVIAIQRVIHERHGIAVPKGTIDYWARHRAWVRQRPCEGYVFRTVNGHATRAGRSRVTVDAIEPRYRVPPLVNPTDPFPGRVA